MKEQIEEMARNLENHTCMSQFQAEIASRTLYLLDYRKQEWISIDDELPEECKNVLCFEGKKIVIAFMEKTEDCGEYVPVFWDWIAYDRDDTYDEVCATHWMPLPEPPKMKGGAE